MNPTLVRQVGVTRMLTVGQSATRSKQKSKKIGVYLCLVDDQGHIIFGQWSMACYIFTIDFKVQFMQVYSVIQNYM